MHASYEEKISALKNREKELDDFMDLGQKLIGISNDLMKKTDKADSYLRFRYASKRYLKQDANPPSRALLYTIIFGKHDKDKILDKIYRIVSNMSPLMKSFAVKLNAINKNQLNFIKTANLKEWDISVTFLDYFYCLTANDVKNKKDLSDDYKALDNLCEKTGKIINEAFRIKEVIAKTLDKLYTNYRNTTLAQTSLTH